MTKKRAQVTIFIIIAIIIISLIVLGVLLLSKINKNNSPDSEIMPVYGFIKNCIDESFKESINEIGLKGGNLISLNKTYRGVPYYLYEGNNLMPKKEYIEEQINILTQFYVLLCVSNLTQFNDYEINLGNLTLKSKINENEITMDNNYPIIIKKSGKMYKIDKFEIIKSKVRLGYLINIAKEIVDEEMKNPESLCISCLYNISKKYNVYISFYDISDNETIITISDSLSYSSKYYYTYVFAIKYKNKEFESVEDLLK